MLTGKLAGSKVPSDGHVLGRSLNTAALQLHEEVTSGATQDLLSLPMPELGGHARGIVRVASLAVA